VETVDEPWSAPAGAELRQRQRAELDARYGFADHEPGPPPSEEDIAVFLVAYQDGEAVACGALRQLDSSSAEIKRMYVVPSARGTGVATAVLRALEDAAVARGWFTVMLETGTEQPDAQRFYEREGYKEIPLFGNYVGSTLSVCYSKVLS
jgi:putative acetyltransferase